MLKWLEYFFRKKEVAKEKEEVAVVEQNPFLPHFRWILEQILEKYGVSYGDIRPLLLDRDTEPESMLSEDDVELVLEQMSEDLNFLRIATERPVYFSYYIEKMYEENGLVVQLESKKDFSLERINLVLDMEQKSGLHRECIKEQIHYIPIYKKPWNQAENLDISVPIGYNTVIVKGM